MARTEGETPLYVLVVDTNIHLSRFWRNFFFFLVDEGTVLVCLSTGIYQELSNVFYGRDRGTMKTGIRRMKFTAEEARRILSLIKEVHSHGRALWKIPDGTEFRESIKAAISDKDDYHVVELAIQCGAQYIITKDGKFPLEYTVDGTSRVIKSLPPLGWLEEVFIEYGDEPERQYKFLEALAFASALTNKNGLDEALAELKIEPGLKAILSPLMPELRLLYDKSMARLD